MKKSSSTETFILNNIRSVKRLSKNVRGEENSPRSYFWFLHALLQSVGGVIEQADLEAAVLKHYGPGFGPDDLRMMGKGRLRQPKWKNSLALAKVMARRRWQDESGNLTSQIVQRSRQEAGVKKTYIVLIDATITDPEWIEWVLGRKAQPMGQVLRRCPKCGNRQPLRWTECEKCKRPFPKAERKHKVPVPRQSNRIDSGATP
jgi:hypothetical protein